MALQTESAARQPGVSAPELMLDASFGHLVFEYRLAVQLHSDRAILVNDLLGVPDVVDHGRLVEPDDVFLGVCRRLFRAPGDMLDAVQAARPPPVAVTVVTTTET